MKKFAFLACVLLALSSFGQKIYNLNDIKTEELKMLVKRPIIILEDVNSQNYIDQAEKKMAKAKKPERKKDLETAIAFSKKNLEYTNKEFINDFKKIWPFKVPSIEFKTFDDVKGMRKAKNSKYTIVYIREFSLQTADINDKWMEDVAMSCLTFQASENFGRSSKVYAIPIPKHSKIEYDKHGIKLSARILANDINYVLKSNPKGKLKDFVADQIAKNCGQLKNVTVYCDQTMTEGKATKSELKSAYGNKIEFVAKSEIESKLSNGTPDYILMPMPEYITSGSFLIISSVAILHARAVINDETGDIVGWTDFVTGENVAKLNLKPKHMSNISSCK